MALCNVEFFDRDLNNIHHDISEISSIDEDYLAISTSSLTINQTDVVKKGDYIYISGPFSFFGLVSEISDSKEYLSTVSFEPFLSIFDHDIVFQVSKQNSSSVSLEDTIMDIFKSYYINTSDSYQKIRGLSVVANSSTTNWSFGITEDQEGIGYAIVNFYSDIITKALTDYKIAVNVSPNLTGKKIDLTIGVTNGEFNIDADSITVEIKEFTTNKESSETNKLEIYNDADYTKKITYYLHTDHTYDTTDSDRITPVVFETQTVSVSDDTPFETAAKEAATSLFGSMEWTNLIELEVGANDTLVDPLNLKFGQEVYVVHDGTAYNSILTGRTLANNITLTFGTIRLDLSKKLKMGGSL